MTGIKLIKTPDEFSKEIGKWNELLSKQSPASPFFSAEWILTCMEYSGKNMAIGVIETGERFTAAVAGQVFQSEGGAFLKRVSVLSFEPRVGTVRPDSLVVMIDPEAGPLPVESLIKSISDYLKWDVIFFQYWNDSVGWLKESTMKLFKDREFWTTEGFSAPEAWVDMSLPEEDYYSGRSKKMKRAVSNAYNRIARSSQNTSFSELCDEKMSISEIEGTVLDMYSRSWQSASGDSPLTPKVRESVFRSMERFFNKGKLSVVVLKIDLETVSFLVSFLENENVYPVAIGYDKNYEDYSAGSILIKNCYGHFRKRNMKALYFGPVKEESGTAYKKKWATRMIDVGNILFVKKRSLYGLIFFLYKNSRLFRAFWWRFFKKKS